MYIGIAYNVNCEFLKGSTFNQSSTFGSKISHSTRNSSVVDCSDYFLYLGPLSPFDMMSYDCCYGL